MRIFMHSQFIVKIAQVRNMLGRAASGKECQEKDIN
jgi:hypothetical protein